MNGALSMEYDQVRVEDAANRFPAIFTLSLLAVGGVLFSLLFLFPLSLRLDESQSLWQSSHSLSGTLRIIAMDVHVPLYQVILHYWQFVWGRGVPEARLLSLLFYVLCIPAIYGLGRLSFNSRTGFFAAALAALSPFLLWYGSEIRMYTLLTLASVLNQYAFVRIMQKKGRTGWIPYFLSASVGIYVHYFFWLNLAAQALFVIARRDLFGDRPIRTMLLIGGGLLLVFSPWIAFVVQLNQIGNSEPLLSVPASVNIFLLFSEFLFGFHNDAIASVILAFWPLAALGIFMVLRRGTYISDELMYFIVALIFPIISVFLFSFYRPIFLTRYLIITLPAFYLILAWMVGMYSRPIEAGVKLLTVIVMVIMLSEQAFGSTAPVKENYASVAKLLERSATPQDVIIISPPFTVYPLEYYYQGTAKYVTLPGWDRTAYGPIPAYSRDRVEAEAERVVQNHRRAWVVLSYDQGYEKEVREFFDRRYRQIYAEDFSRGLRLIGYEIDGSLPLLARQ